MVLGITFEDVGSAWHQTQVFMHARQELYQQVIPLTLEFTSDEKAFTYITSGLCMLHKLTNHLMNLLKF